MSRRRIAAILIGSVKYVLIVVLANEVFRRYGYAARALIGLGFSMVVLLLDLAELEVRGE